MQQVQAYPPNIDLIRVTVPVPPDAVFSYGGVIYNPSGREILPDVEYHESIHARQQGSDPDSWWYSWLTDPAFRLEQELEAYGEQYLFAKERIEEAEAKANEEGKSLAAGKVKLLDYALESLAGSLSGPAYGNLITHNEARSKIRNYRRN